MVLRVLFRRRDDILSRRLFVYKKWIFFYLQV